MTSNRTASAGRGVGIGVRGTTSLIRVYQLARAGHVSPCRFTPSCSEYTLQAVGTHGVRHGVGLALRRLFRCRPGGAFGYDPVPPTGEWPPAPTGKCPPPPANARPHGRMPAPPSE